MMHSIFLAFGIALVILMALTLIRALIGPTILDRILGGNVIGTKTTVLLLIIGELYNNLGMFVDIALAYALLNFLATLGAAKFFLRRLRVFCEEDEQEEQA